MSYSYSYLILRCQYFMPQPQEEKNLAALLPEPTRWPEEKPLPSLPETISSTETNLEPEAQSQLETNESSSIDKAIDSLKQLVRMPKKVLPAIPLVRDEITVRVEKIMEENLADAYRALDPVKRQEFKIKGEATAQAIRQLLNKTKVKIKKIFQLILEWLLFLPGINRFYLEQEAKIKADRILALKNHIRDRM